MANAKCNESYIREAAYYLWQNAGCPSGQDEKFWSMAVEQLSSTCSGNTKKCCAKKTTSTTKSCSNTSKSKK